MRSNKQILRLAISVIVVAVLVMGCGQQQAEIEKQKEIARLVIEEAWNKGNLDVMDEHYAPDYVYHQTPFPDIQGLDAYKQFITDNRTNYPDIRQAIDDIVVEGDKVVIRGTYQGTQEGTSPTLGISTGKRVDFKWCIVSRKVNGKTVEDWAYVDWLGFMQQLGYKMNPPLTETTFARVTLTQGKPDMMNETIKLYKDSVVPAAKSQKGYRGAYLLSDFQKGKGISISLWESEEDAVANEQSGYYQEQVDKFKDFFTAQPVREGYIVTVQE
ncbi:ester cyclase [Candidatus Latescibacterota bacterium]